MYKSHRRQVISIGATIAAAATLAACGTASSPHGQLAQDKAVLAGCDHGKPPASLVELDVSGSSLSEAIVKERMAAVEAIARRTAICSGYLRVSLFAVSSADTTVLFDGPLHLDGATENARLKKAPRVVGQTMDTIGRAYGPAAKSMPHSASDIIAQYRLGSEWIGQLGGRFQLHLYLLTDGFQTVGVKINRALGKQKAAELAGKTNVPKLPGAVVTVAGLGRTAGSPPRSDVVEGLAQYYDTLCRKTGAAQCVSVTDYTAAGGR
ncbi:hypothetical protein [Actinomadura formosensis]|uniref:hypothetical protein n=1 Tax=Actinomadura formosensis TaxID=60706 RepID=UPI0008353C22|nr:hypothetical protein [Actinomadura formosensis]